MSGPGHQWPTQRGERGEEKKECWGRGVRGKCQERVGENINQCGMGVWLSGSALSARQIGKHFNGFLSTAPLTTLSGSIACTLDMPQ